MITKEAEELLEKVQIVMEWYEERTGGEYTTGSENALELLKDLEKVGK